MSQASVLDDLRHHTGGGAGNRTRVKGFAGPCLNHSATPPESGQPIAHPGTALARPPNAAPNVDGRAGGRRRRRLCPG
jgi:hypothetical protein